jgi:hypothetical protein
MTDAKKKMGLGKKILIGIGGFIVLVVAINMIGGKNELGSTAAATSAAPAPAPTITAVALSQEYKKNEVAADETWKGKRAEVTGKVSRIEKDFTDAMHVHLAVSSMGLDDVDCKMPDTQKSWVAGLKKGELITVRGKVTGMVVGIVGIEAEP